jgi:hypothetical protein
VETQHVLKFNWKKMLVPKWITWMMKSWYIPVADYREEETSSGRIRRNRPRLCQTIIDGFPIVYRSFVENHCQQRGFMHNKLLTLVCLWHSGNVKRRRRGTEMRIDHRKKHFPWFYKVIKHFILLKYHGGKRRIRYSYII